MAAAGLILAIIAIVLSFIPCVGYLAFVPGILGIIFSAIGLSQSRQSRRGKWLALPGLVFSVTAAVWPFLFWFVVAGGVGIASTLGALAISLAGLDAAGIDNWEDLSAAPKTRTGIFAPHSVSSSGANRTPHSVSTRSGTTTSTIRTTTTTTTTIPLSAEEAEERRAIEAGIQALRNGAGQENPGIAWERVRMLRSRINQLAASGRLHEELDQAIVAVLDALAEPHYRRAEQLARAENYPEALEACDKALDIYSDEGRHPPFHAPDNVGSAVFDQANTFYERLQLWADPYRRFELRGIATSNDEGIANVYDHAIGDWFRVREGDRVGGFLVTKVDWRAKILELEANGEKVRLR